MLTEKLMYLTIAGGSQWVMVVLILLSVTSIAVIVERGLFFRRQRPVPPTFSQRIEALREAGFQAQPQPNGSTNLTQCAFFVPKGDVPPTR